MKRNSRQIDILSSCLLSVFILLGSSLATQSSANSSLRRGFPGRRIGTGYRCPTCIEPGSHPQIVLMPESNLISTAKSQPVFLFYLPAISEATNLELVIKDQDGIVYRAVTPGNGSSGIVRLDLSQLTPSFKLEENKDYRWHLSILCNAENVGKTIETFGMIRHVPPGDELSASVASEPSLTQIEQLRTTALWADGLASLDQIRREQPDNLEIRAHWQDFLATKLEFDLVTYEALIESPPIASPFEGFLIDPSEQAVADLVTSDRDRPTRATTP